MVDDTTLNRSISVFGDTIPTATFRVTCLAKGTKILLGDNSYKNVEDVVLNDVIMSFNHETGAKEAAEVCVAYKGKNEVKPVILHFESGKSLSIVGVHSILEQSTLKYVQLADSNVDKFIWKKFYDAVENRWDTLISYEIGSKPVEYYSIYSMNVNCITNDFLTAPDDVDYELNIYKLDSNLKADADQLAADIAQYGLLDVQKECPEHPELWDVIYALGKYVYIAIGKGLTTLEYVKSLYKFWDE